MMTPKKIFIVEDEGIIAERLQRTLSNLGYKIAGAVSTGEKALELIPATNPDLVLMDIRLAGEIDGIETTSLLHKKMDTPVIYLSAFSEESLLEKAKATDPYNYLIKPIQDRELYAAIEMAIYKHETKKRLEASEQRYRIISEVTSDFAYSLSVMDNNDLALDWITPAFENITGYSIEKIKTVRSFIKLIHQDDVHKIRGIASRFTRGEEINTEIRVIKKNKEVCWVKFTARPIWDTEHKKIVSIYGAAYDITKRKFVENELLELNNELELRVAERTAQLEDAVAGLQREIKSRLEIEEKLRESEERYRNLIEFSPDAIAVHYNGKVLFANPSTFKLMGAKNADEIINKPILDFVHPDQKQFVIDRVKESSKNNEVIPPAEEKFIKLNGEVIDVETTGVPTIFNGNRAIQVIFRDITERKRAEATLRESEEKYRTLVQNIPGVVYRCEVNAPWKKSMMSEAAASLTGYKVDDFIKSDGITFASIIDQKDIAKIEKAVTEAVNEKRQFDLEYRITHHDGKKLWVHEIGQAYYDSSGKPQWLEGVIIDITDRRNAQIELRKLSRAVQQSSAGIVITDTSGKIEYTNPKFSEMTGYSPEEIIGNYSRIFKSGEQPVEYYQRLWNTILSGQEWSGEFHNKKKNGELYWEFSVISPIKNDKGEITNFLAIKEDITERKKIERELIKSKEIAEDANKLKSSLLANMSHEFRTPLNGILGFSQLLKDEITESDHLDMIEKIIRSGKRLMNTLNSILTLTDLENNSYLIQKSEVDLGFFCQQIKTLYGSLTQAKNLWFNIELEKDELSTVIDENILTKIVSNLVENAVKYTLKGGVTVQLKTAIRNGQHLALINITDTGIGIKEKDQDIIFKEFKQLSEGFRRDFEGLGLGLTLSKRMANLIGCDILVESELGKGSTFTITIPLPSTDKKDSTEINEEPVQESFKKLGPQIKKSQMEILIIEDNPLNVEVVQRFLSKTGTVSSANNGVTAIGMVKEHQYDLLLIDINLGQGIDGIEVARQIRKLESYASVPIIALTGYASDSSRREFLSHGFTHYLAKPFEKHELLDLIKKIF